MRKTGKKLALILTMAITLTLFTSCGGKKSDVGGLGDDNKVNNIFNQGLSLIHISEPTRH